MKRCSKPKKQIKDSKGKQIRNYAPDTKSLRKLSGADKVVLEGLFGMIPENCLFKMQMDREGPVWRAWRWTTTRPI